LGGPTYGFKKNPIEESGWGENLREKKEKWETKGLGGEMVFMTKRKKTRDGLRKEKKNGTTWEEGPMKGGRSDRAF